jgi:hypothetical protein
VADKKDPMVEGMDAGYDVPTDAEMDSPAMRSYVDQDVARLKKMLEKPDQAAAKSGSAS